jgi:hypothetical protein
VVNNERAVERLAHVELDARDPKGHRVSKGLEGIFALLKVGSSVREDGGHAVSLARDQELPN